MKTINKSDRQYRAMSGLLLSADQKLIDTTHYVEGYATRFDRYPLYETESGIVYEKFDPDCFRHTDMSDVILQFDHAGKVYARQSNKTLIVRVDDKGLFVAADLSKTAAARDLYDEIQAGMVTKMSWGFRGDDYDYDEATRTIVWRSIKKIYDVSAVSLPANNDTEISARSLVDGVIQQAEEERLEREHRIRRLQLLIRLGETEL